MLRPSPNHGTQRLPNDDDGANRDINRNNVRLRAIANRGKSRDAQTGDVS